MTTATALERLSDTGKFEILATRALRQLHPECRCLEHLGVNAQGKTIPGPIDGFAQVPGSNPTRYVAAAFTIAARRELKRKWYSDGNRSGSSERQKKSEAGDLVKACREAENLRNYDAESTFTIYLCTNQQLDKEIMDGGYKIARHHSVDVIFLGQSRLRDFLDSADGQTLREEFLGLKATKVSRELIQTLARASAKQYQVDGFSDDEFVPTAAWNEARDALTLGAPVLALVGRPGFGKSVIARSLLERHVTRGGLGFWIPGDFLQEALSLTDLIKLTLSQLYPYLGDDAGHATRALATPDDPLVLVFDDVNRTDRPGPILKKILDWGRTLAAEGAEEVKRQGIQFVVPIWESQFSNVRDFVQNAKWVQIRSVGPMQRTEAITCLRNGLRGSLSDLSDIELDHIAEHMHEDPILLSIFAGLVRSNQASNLDLIQSDVIGRFVDRSLDELAASKDALRANYGLALARLTREMLVRKVLHPEWRELRGWLDSDTILHLEHIAAHGHVCRIANQGRRDIFEFRHDRILEHQLCQTIAAEFQRAEPDWNGVFDPFMVHVTGRALATNGVSESVLDLAEARLPTSLVAALAFLPPGDTTLSNQLCLRIARWMRSISRELPSVQSDALSILENTCSKHILDVTKDISPNRQTLLARLRNGDAVAGASALSEEFHPSSRYSWLESLVAQAKSRHRQRLVDQLADFLKNPECHDLIKAGALTLAGYLGESSLAASILIAWQSAQDPKSIILPALWAGLRCSDQEGNPLVAILPAILSVSDEQRAGGFSDRKELFEELAFSARHGISCGVLTLLKNLAERDERYLNLVWWLFGRIDHRICLEFVVKRSAKAAAKPVESGKVSSVFLWEHQWRRRTGFEDSPLPSDCVDALQELWQPENPDWLRTYAFKLWLRLSGDSLWTTDLPKDLSDSDTSIWERAQRGDRRVVEPVLRKMAISSHWFQMIRYLWSERFESVLDLALKTGDSFAVNALRDVPTATAERLVLSNWSAICHDYSAIAAALYIARPSTVSLVSELVSSHPDPAYRFRHAGRHFGFQEHGYSARITLRHLDVLRPFVHLLDDFDLADITEFCGRNSYREWADYNVLAEARRRLVNGNQNLIAGAVRRHFPTDEELMFDLDRIAALDDDRHARGDMWFWGRQFNERSDKPERMHRVLENWLKTDISVTRFRLAALAIGDHGSRRSLGILRQFSSVTAWPSMEAYWLDAEYAVKRRSLL